MLEKLEEIENPNSTNLEQTNKQRDSNDYPKNLSNKNKNEWIDYISIYLQLISIDNTITNKKSTDSCARFTELFFSLFSAKNENQEQQSFSYSLVLEMYLVIHEKFSLEISSHQLNSNAFSILKEKWIEYNELGYVRAKLFVSSVDQLQAREEIALEIDRIYSSLQQLIGNSRLEMNLYGRFKLHHIRCSEFAIKLNPSLTKIQLYKNNKSIMNEFSKKYPLIALQWIAFKVVDLKLENFDDDDEVTSVIFVLENMFDLELWDSNSLSEFGELDCFLRLGLILTELKQFQFGLRSFEKAGDLLKKIDDENSIQKALEIIDLEFKLDDVGEYFFDCANNVTGKTTKSAEISHRLRNIELFQEFRRLRGTFIDFRHEEYIASRIILWYYALADLDSENSSKYIDLAKLAIEERKKVSAQVRHLKFPFEQEQEQEQEPEQEREQERSEVCEEPVNKRQKISHVFSK